MDLTQIVIVISLLSITTIVVISGIYLIRLLKELQSTVIETNHIISSISRPVDSFSEFIMGFKNGFSLLNSFFKKDKKEAEK